MNERELRAVAEAIAEQVYTMHTLTKPAEFEAIVNRAAKAVLDIVQPMLRQRDQHIEALMRLAYPTPPEKE